MTPPGSPRSLLPQLLDPSRARRRIVSAALREWKRIQAAAEAPGDTGQDGGEQDA